MCTYTHMYVYIITCTYYICIIYSTCKTVPDLFTSTSVYTHRVYVVLK